MKPRRLPPQPTDTALARFVQRLVDSMPWVIIRRLRAEVYHQRTVNAFLLRDYENLLRAGRHQEVRPIPSMAIVRRDLVDFGRAEALVIDVTYERRRAGVIISLLSRRLHQSISEVTLHALNQVAERVARDQVSTHRDLIVQLALGGKTIEEVLKK